MGIEVQPLVGKYVFDMSAYSYTEILKTDSNITVPGFNSGSKSGPIFSNLKNKQVLEATMMLTDVILELCRMP